MAKINKKLQLKIKGTFGTQADFADKVKMDDSLLSKIVNGRRPFPEDQSRSKWARLLGCSVADLGV